MSVSAIRQLNFALLRLLAVIREKNVTLRDLQEACAELRKTVSELAPGLISELPQITPDVPKVGT